MRGLLVTNREFTDLPHAALDLLIRSGHGDAHEVFCYRAEVAASGDGDVAVAQQVEGELSAPAWCAPGVADIDQRVKGAVGSVEGAIVLLEEADHQVAATAIGFAHLGHAVLRAG